MSSKRIQPKTSGTHAETTTAAQPTAPSPEPGRSPVFVVPPGVARRTFEDGVYL